MCRNPHEKAMQRALIQYRNPKNYDLVYEALTRAGRTDLIGYDKKCLIRPRKTEHNGKTDYERQTDRAGKAGHDQKTGYDLKKGTFKEKYSADMPKNKGKKKTIRNVHTKKKDKFKYDGKNN